MPLAPLLLPLTILTTPPSTQAPLIEEAQTAEQARFRAEVREAAEQEARQRSFARSMDLDQQIRREKIRMGLSFGAILPGAYVAGLFGCLAGSASENPNMDCGTGGIIGASLAGSLFLGLGIMHVFKLDKLKEERRVSFGYLPRRGGGSFSARMSF